jgi:hypothetical protein
MKTFSDVERYEVSLIDGEGNKNHFIGRIRNFEFLSGWNKFIKERAKATEAKDNEKAIHIQYEMMGFLFGVDTAIMKAYSNETIGNIITDYAEFVEKKKTAQVKAEK